MCSYVFSTNTTIKINSKLNKFQNSSPVYTSQYTPIVIVNAQCIYVYQSQPLTTRILPITAETGCQGLRPKATLLTFSAGVVVVVDASCGRIFFVWIFLAKHDGDNLVVVDIILRYQKSNRVVFVVFAPHWILTDTNCDMTTSNKRFLR